MKNNGMIVLLVLAIVVAGCPKRENSPTPEQPGTGQAPSTGTVPVREASAPEAAAGTTSTAADSVAKEEQPGTPGTTAEAAPAKQPEAPEAGAEAVPVASEGTQADSEKQEDRRPNGRTRTSRGADEASEPSDPNEVRDPMMQMEAINLNNVEMKEIVQKISAWTGKVIIPTNDDVMRQRITIYSSEQVTRADALALIWAALRTKGFIGETSGNVTFLKPIADSRLGYVPIVPHDVALASIMDKNQMVQKIFELKHYQPSRMSQMLSPLIATYGYIAADDRTRQLTIIDTVERLIRMESIVTQFDVPQSMQMQEKIFQIQKADPAEVVQLLEKLLTVAGARQGGGGRSGPGGNQPATPAVILEQSATQIILIPEPRHKWIIARASPEDMIVVEQWIIKLDMEMQVQPEYDILQVRYIDVSDLTDRVNRTLQQMPGSQLQASVLLQPLPTSSQVMIFGSQKNRDMVRKLIEELDQPNAGLFEEETFVLKHADPETIKNNIESLYMPVDSQASIWSRQARNLTGPDSVRAITYSALGRITVIASPPNMAKIRSQIAEWDVPVEIDKVRPRIIELRNSDPMKMATLLRTLFSDSGNSQRSWIDLYLGTSNDKGKIMGPLYGQLTFEAVPDTSKIIVISKIPAAYEVVEELIRELDSKEMAQMPGVVTLKYADPEDLSIRLNAMFTDVGTPANIFLSKQGLSDYQVDQETGARTGTGGTAATDAAANSYTPPWTRGRERTDQAPISNVIGKIRFIPEIRSKSILVLAPSEYIDEIIDTIKQLDQPARQVMIQATIMEINHDDLSSLGARLSSNRNALGDIGENAVLALTELRNATTRGTFTTLTAANVNVLVDLLMRKTNARILNQPTLWTRDNEEAVFFKGRSIPFVVSSQTSTEGTAQRDQVEYRGVGVTLRVRPNITPDKAVDMAVNLMVSQEDGYVNGNITTSLLDTTTKAILADGQTIMIGGMLFQSQSRAVTKVPLLGDLPLLGGLFRHTNVRDVNRELLVFITPHVIDGGSASTDEGARQQEHARARMEQLRNELFSGNKAVYETEAEVPAPATPAN